MVYRVSSAHEEGGERLFAVSTTEFVDDGQGRVRALRLTQVTMENGQLTVVAGSETEIPADYVFLAMGFVGPEASSVSAQLGVTLDSRGNIVRTDDYRTNVDGVFAAGDAGRGQSLIVWAIAEGRSAAAAVDAFLTGDSNLPVPIPSSARPLFV